MNDPIFCPACGGEMERWQADILECSGCGNMVDKEVLEEMEE